MREAVAQIKWPKRHIRSRIRIRKRNFIIKLRKTILFVYKRFKI
jgi:hypothetical protein